MNQISKESAKELFTIMKLLPEEEFQKIPFEILKKLEILQEEKEIKIQKIEDIKPENMLEETKNNLAYLFLNYLANEEEKEAFSLLLQENEERYQNEATEKYSIEQKFEKKKQRTVVGDRNKKEALTVIPKEKLWYKLWCKIQKIFRK